MKLTKELKKNIEDYFENKTGDELIEIMEKHGMTITEVEISDPSFTEEPSDIISIDLTYDTVTLEES
ncbi:gp71 [Sphingomonas phage PAU]|uniref:gp71 n=1 Tax=Sphingomonas phage PAU TaxID=1150991 RepID=UPI00025731D1|nr:gp71 [Sphingomonas phage PAU]AFF28069.1 gp71 [Sphingomonas phage PAU]